jgi:hypothetical protein
LRVETLRDIGLWLDPLLRVVLDKLRVYQEVVELSDFYAVDSDVLVENTS